MEPFLKWNDLSFQDYFDQLVASNWQVIFFIFLIILSLLSYAIFQNDSRYGNKIATKFTGVTSSNFDHLTFLSTYIIPLITFNLNEPRSFLVVVILLLMIGMIYVKSNLYYLNPTLLLFGYKIYRAKKDQEEVVLIAKRNISEMSNKLQYKDLDNNIYLIKG